MADLAGYDDDFPELKKLNQDVLESPDDFEIWEKLVRATESLDGSLNRNSSPQAIAAYRAIFDRFLTRFPLFFGYWKKYADLEFSIAGTESAEMIYERGIASISISVDLWREYCSFKTNTCHDVEAIRELFERGASFVGLDFMSHPFWDTYLEFEERQEQSEKIFSILDRVIHIPMHQYARYFERYRQMAATRPLTELLPPDLLSQFRSEVEQEFSGKRLNDWEVERDLRTRIDNFHLEIFHRTQTETTKRWTYEQEIKRPYFHVTELDEAQLVNWRKYLDFEEIEGNYQRTAFLYERCLVTCAYYDEFWLRYARWMFSQENKEEEVRLIYERASCIFVPIGRPTIRLNWAVFEESTGRVDVAREIHKSILLLMPGHFLTIQSWAQLERRHGGLDAAIDVYKTLIDDVQIDLNTKGHMVAEWARQLWKVKGSVQEAREVYQKNAHWYMGSRAFWINYYQFERDQPTSAELEPQAHSRIKRVVDELRKKGQLPPSTVKDIVHDYMVYLLERGTADDVKEWLELDMEINGPFTVRSSDKAKLAEDGKEGTTHRRMVLENGHPGVEINEALFRKGENPYAKYYSQQGENPNGPNGQPAPMRYS